MHSEKSSSWGFPLGELLTQLASQLQGLNSSLCSKWVSTCRGSPCTSPPIVIISNTVFCPKRTGGFTLKNETNAPKNCNAWHIYTFYNNCVLWCCLIEFTIRLCEWIITYKYVQKTLYCVKMNNETLWKNDTARTRRSLKFELNSQGKAWVTLGTCCGPAGTKRKKHGLQKTHPQNKNVFLFTQFYILIRIINIHPYNDIFVQLQTNNYVYVQCLNMSSTFPSS